MGRAPVDFASRAEPFAMHPHVLVTAPTHRFARAESVPAQALADEPFIVREPASGTRTALQEYLDRHRLKPSFVMEMPSNEAIKQAVMAGMGVSLLSLHTIGLEWQQRADRRADGGRPAADAALEHRQHRGQAAVAGGRGLPLFRARATARRTWRRCSIAKPGSAATRRPRRQPAGTAARAKTSPLRRR